MSCVENEVEDARKLFIGGLYQDVTDEELSTLFGELCGGGADAIQSLKINRPPNPKPTSRLVAFVTFTSGDLLHEVLLKRPIQYKDRELEVKHATLRGDDPRNLTKKCFLRRAPKDNPEGYEEKIKADFDRRYCSKYGHVEKVQLTRSEDDSSRSRGYGFIHCSSEDFADRIAITDRKYVLDGMEMEIQKSNSGGGDRGGDRGGRGGRGGGGRGGGYNNRGGGFNNRGGGFNNRGGSYGNRGDGHGNRGNNSYGNNQGGNQGGYGGGGYNQGSYGNNQGGYRNNRGGYDNNQGGYNNNQGGYGNNQGDQGWYNDSNSYNRGGYNQSNNPGGRY